MKNILFIFLFIFNFPMIVLSSDNDQKYKLALEKIENNNFTIIMTEAFSKDGNPNLQRSDLTESYITVSGKQITLRIDPLIEAFNTDSHIVDKNSSIKKIKTDKHGNSIYSGIVKRDKTGDHLELRITLYKNGNLAYVQIKTIKYKREILGMKGYIDIEGAEAIKQ
ncbi:MAG: DUF4251 domain-containing protein [Bacteroidales bacterium]